MDVPRYKNNTGGAKITTPRMAIKNWEALPKNKREAKKLGAKVWRNRKTARVIAKEVDKKWANGGYFKSMGEVYMVEELRKMKASKKIKGFLYEPEVWEYQHEPQKYTVDFRVIKNNDDMIFLEYKGVLDNDTKRKLRAIKRCNPNKKLYLIFERGQNKIRKGSHSTYMDWADAKGFPCADKEIPDKWIKVKSRKRKKRADV